MKESAFPQDKSAMAEKLHKLLFSKHLDMEETEALLNISRLRQFNAEETIYKEGTKNNWLYFLLSGSVSIIQDEQEIADFEKPGTFLGEDILAGSSKHTSTVVTNKTTACVAIESDIKKHLENAESAKACAILYRLTSQILAIRAKSLEKELQMTQHELDIVKTNKWNSQ